jgi:hypothetical protein
MLPTYLAVVLSLSVNLDRTDEDPRFDLAARRFAFCLAKDLQPQH